MQQLVAREHECPVFSVVVCVNNSEHKLVQVYRSCAARNVDEIELHRLIVWRFPSDQPRPVASFAVVNKREVIAVQINHCGFRCSSGRNLMH